MAMARKSDTRRLFVLFVVLINIFVHSSSALSEAEILVKFKSTLFNVTTLSNWNKSTSPCTGDVENWVGIRCSAGAVSTLILENMGMRGLIDVDTLVGLPSLRSLSFMNNNFDGPLPDVKKLSSLRALYLSLNSFSGVIQDDGFSGMNSLKKLYLARNEFTGKLPNSLVDLPNLLELSVEGNRFDGEIPDFKQNKFVVMNLANNQFEGRIPASLSKISASSFLGNKDLCGMPLEPCKNSKKPSVEMIAIIAAAGATLLVVIIALFFTICGRSKAKKSQVEKKPTAKVNKKVATTAYGGGGGGQKGVVLPDHAAAGDYKKSRDQGKLYFVRNGIERFELQDLLRASAEVLGSGSFGSSYKAVLLSGPAMVVKRFRQMSNVGKEEFQEHMKRLGRLSHPNLLPIVAFYYQKEEKLLISDFIENGCLASHLHSKRASGQPGLDWPTRLQIIKGVAKGLAYLYKELPGLTLPHGHLKSSNVLLDHTFEPLLMDYALVPIMDKEHAQQFMVAYKSPEFAQNDRVTRKTDVWSLGILILEMLTGKFPANFLKQGKGNNADLAAWVNSVVREEWTGEVFDKDMKGTKNEQGEMLKLLKIGMDCCEWSLEKRWDLREAVEKIDELKERDSEEDYSSNASEGDMYSSRAISDDDFSFSVTK